MFCLQDENTIDADYQLPKPDAYWPSAQVFIGTWNMGNAMPPAFTRADGLGFLDMANKCDIVAIGVQESTYETKARASDAGECG